MAAFVLIHGSWHGAWRRDLLVPRLKAAGHSVIAPDLPGRGEDRSPLADATLDGWAKLPRRTA